MPYKRNYEREKQLAKRRGDVGGSDSANAERKRARRLWEREKGKVPKGYEVHHKKPLKHGGKSTISNLQVIPASKNRAHGGKIGDRDGKLRGAIKGGAALRKKLREQKKK